MQIGLKHYLSKVGQPQIKQPIARLVSEHKTEWDMITEHGLVKGILMNTLRKQMKEDKLPKVGDWVEFDKLQGENKAKITKVLRRYSSLVRNLESKRTQQTIATNIDVMFIVLSVDQIFNPLQLNRYLSLAAEGNILPVVVINKTDKQIGAQKEVSKIIKEILAIHPKQKVISTSAKSKSGLFELQQLIKSGHTAVLVGNSGTGKSSIVNALQSLAQQATAAVSQSGKGRHTTTHRQLFVLPNGGIIIDTPGMRTLELIPTKTSSTSIFKELEELSRHCKYRNCDHVKSAGCAIKEAINKKVISREQLNQFLALSTKHIRKVNYNKSRN